VIAEPRAELKHTECVTVCPVDCIRVSAPEIAGKIHDQRFIDPDERTDCDLCELQFSVNAIFCE
jgi:NAD-dependent dihydropyrimidine dehydrogenase PreA subunit